MIMKFNVLGEVIVGGNYYGFTAGDNDNVHVVTKSAFLLVTFMKVLYLVIKDVS